MATGLLNTGLVYKSRALSGFMDTAKEESRIDEENKQLKAQAKAQKITTIGSSVGTGAAIGSEILPGWGTLIGAGIGFIFGELF